METIQEVLKYIQTEIELARKAKAVTLMRKEGLLALTEALKQAIKAA